MRTSTQKILRLSVASVAMGFALLAAPAFAQDAPAEGDEAETIVVTGSRIARPDLENSTPTLVVGAASLENRGIENFADLASQLPQFAASFGSSRTQSTFSGAATSGLNTVNLRNLGGGRTLTLMNGRRMASGTTTGTSVDFNTIPAANIARIDIITGGASAIYGADAVAGVVNIITDRSLRGFEFGASGSIASRGDNANPNVYLRYGSDLGDGGHLQATVQYDYQGLVNCSKRTICAEDFAWFPPSASIYGPAAYSAVGVNGTFFLTAGAAGSGLGAVSATRIGDSLSFTDSAGNLIPFVTTRDGYNRNARRNLAIPTNRYLAALDIEYPISDNLDVFAEFNYGRSTIVAAFEGHPFQSTAAGSLFGGGPGVTGLQASIPVTNPFVPTAVRNAALARGMTTINWQQRFEALSDRGASNKREMFRVVAGIKGNVELASRNWNWELSYVRGETKLNSITRGLVSTSNLYHGLRVEADPASPGNFRCIDATARTAGCVPINPFAPYTEAMKTALRVDAGQNGKSVLDNVVGYVAGDLFALPGGNLSVALGGEYRRFSGFLDYDSVINNALVTGNQIGDVTKATITTKEFFVEGVAPLLKDSFIKSLTLEGAYRHSKPNGKDGYNTWRYGGTIEPLDGIKLRVMRARAVRAPTPGELSGISQTFGVVNDPCSVQNRNANTTRAANCLADGVPATYDPPLNVRQSVAGFVGGNTNLNPESATTLTYGIVFAPSFIPRLSITVDRFQMDLRGLISTVGRQVKADACYDTVARLFCGDLTRSTNPNVPGANYVLTAVNDQLINIASYDLRGIDFGLRYSVPLFAGNATIDSVATYYDKALATPTPLTPPLDLVGAAGGSTTDQGWINFTANTNLGWKSDGGFSVNWNVRYIGKAKAAPGSAIEIGDRFYHNVRIGAKIANKMDVYAGIDNIADSKPPFFPSGTSGTQALDTIPAYYDIFGRSFYVGTKIRF